MPGAVYNLGVIDVEYSLLALRDGGPDLGLLDDAERARAARFLDPRARARFVTTRSALRRALAHRLRIEPCDVRFVYGPQGKPALAEGDVTFSVSHAGDLALLAFASGVPIGADIERVREVAHASEIAHRLFGDATPRTREEFFRLWARHEAGVKCVGTTVLAPLREPSRLAVADVPVPPGYVAAIAAATPVLTLTERPLYSAG